MIPFDCPRSCPRAGERFCRFGPIFDQIGPIKVDSHVAKVQCDIRDLDALDAAARRCGLIMKRGQKHYRWYGRSVGDTPLPEGYTAAALGKCDHALAIPGDTRAYEIGVVARADGTGYDLLWDFWNDGYGIKGHVGDECKKLVGEYLHAVAERAALAQGWLCERTESGDLLIHHNAGGTLTVTASGTIDADGFHGVGCHDAILALGIPVANATAKPEFGQVACEVQISR
jgi:hypothetical protein